MSDGAGHALAKNLSTASSQDAEVGVKREVLRRCTTASYALNFRVRVAAIIVEQHMDRPTSWDVTLKAVEKAQEFLGAVGASGYPSPRRQDAGSERCTGLGGVVYAANRAVPPVRLGECHAKAGQAEEKY